MSVDLWSEIKKIWREIDVLKSFDVPKRVSEWTMLETPMTSTDWTADTFSTTGVTKIDLSAVFGVPAGVSAVNFRVTLKDSGSAASDCQLTIGPTNSGAGKTVRCSGIANGYNTNGDIWVKCDANGDVYYNCIASGAGTMTITLQVWGYQLNQGTSINAVTSSIFGTSPNYAMFDTDGTLRTFGTASVIVNNKTALNVDGGFMVRLTNKTGGSSVKGEVVGVSSATSNAVAKIVKNIPDPIGVFYESGIADGAEAWIVVSGIADVYFVGNTTRGHIARGFLTADGASYVTGQALSEAVPSSPFASDKHFYELGHVLESRTGAGLAKVNLHFN